MSALALAPASACMTPGALASPALDVAALYRTFHRRLELTVRAGVSAPDAVIEDACQFAWWGLMRHGGGIEPAAALAWLMTTARREAVHLLRRESAECSLDELIETGAGAAMAAADRSAAWAAEAIPGPEEVCERRARLSALAQLPVRQRRILWLRAAGLSHGEIAARTGETPRSVERQLVSGRRRIRALV